MYFLSIDTCIDTASMALTSPAGILNFEQEGASSHAQHILKGLDDLLAQANIDLNDLSGLVVGRGPGSFTGLRVATSVVKGLAYPRKLPVYPVSSLACLAFMARQIMGDLPVLSIMDARMQQVYWAKYQPQSYQGLEQVTCISQIDGDVTGILATYQIDAYQNLMPSHYKNMQRLKLKPSAHAMLQMLEQGLLQAIDALVLEPHYVRNQVTHGGKNG